MHLMYASVHSIVWQAVWHSQDRKAHSYQERTHHSLQSRVFAHLLLGRNQCHRLLVHWHMKKRQLRQYSDQGIFSIAFVMTNIEDMTVSNKATPFCYEIYRIAAPDILIAVPHATTNQIFRGTDGSSRNPLVLDRFYEHRPKFGMRVDGIDSGRPDISTKIR